MLEVCNILQMWICSDLLPNMCKLFTCSVLKSLSRCQYCEEMKTKVQTKAQKDKERLRVLRRNLSCPLWSTTDRLINGNYNPIYGHVCALSCSIVQSLFFSIQYITVHAIIYAYIWLKELPFCMQCMRNETSKGQTQKREAKLMYEEVGNEKKFD